MNTLEDTLNTLLPAARVLSRNIMMHSEEMFAEDGSVPPAMFAVPPNGDDYICDDVEILDPDTKPIVWAKLRHWREQYYITGWVSEIWRADGKNWTEHKLMPSECPDRTEHVMFQLWQGSRMVTFVADIKRQPNCLAEWKVLYDSDFPGKQAIDSLGGAMMDGPKNSLEGN